MEKAIHHDWHLVRITFSQGHVNGRMVRHMKSLEGLRMYSSADGEL